MNDLQNNSDYAYTPGKLYQERPDPRFERISRIGVLHVGEKDPKTGYPRSLNYFKPSGKYEDLFLKAYGEKPNAVSIVFPSDSVAEVCNARFECWGTGNKEVQDDPNKGRKLAYGDGKTFFVYKEESDSYEIFEGIRSDLHKLPGKWRQLVTLRFLLVKVPVLGYWEFTTSGANTSIPNLVGVYNRVHGQVGNRIVKVPFDLTVDFATSKRPGKQSRYPIVNLVPMMGNDEVTRVRRLQDSLLESVGVLTNDMVRLQIEESEKK